MSDRLHPYRPLIVEPFLTSQHRSVMHKVSILAMPLRADMARLRRFIDSYLNFVDDRYPPPFYFQPMGPYVLFELLHYPYLAVTTRNLTAYPQHEMAFTVPLECYALEDGVMVFKQYAVCTPFIYVDQQVSIVSGRDLFGLPKIAVSFPNVRPQDDPRTASQMALLELRVPTPFGDRDVPFIEVFRDPFRFVSLRHAPRDLLTALPDAMSGYLNSLASTCETLIRSPVDGYDPVIDTQSMIGRSGATVNSFLASMPVSPFFHPSRPVGDSTADILLGPLYSDIITLKQARDAQDRDSVSFQSLVRSTMYIDRLNDFGSLSTPGTTDSSGGLTIKMHRILSQPVVESLGLEVIQDTIVTERRNQENEKLITLRPESPYWLNLDLTYGLGTNLYWRGKDTGWSNSLEPGPAEVSKNRYLTFGGGASQEDRSRLISPQGRIFVLGLPLVDGDQKDPRLNRLCREYLKNDQYEFGLYEGVPPLVWMVIRNLTNTAEGKGPDLEQEVEFCALVQWKQKGGGPPLGIALMPISIFSDTQMAVFTESEILGRPTILSDIHYVSSDWTSPEVEVNEAPVMLCVKASLPPELYAGRAPEYREIVRIVKRPGAPRWRLSSSFEHDSQESDKTLGSNLLKIPSVSLKQVVDCRTPEAADYQAIVMQVLDIGGRCHSPQRLSEPRSLLHNTIVFNEKDFTIKIFKYNSAPLVETMGLKVTCLESDASTSIEVISPVYAISLDLSVQERGAINFASRLGASRWAYLDDPINALERIAPGIKQILRNFPNILVRVFSILENLPVLATLHQNPSLFVLFPKTRKNKIAKKQRR